MQQIIADLQYDESTGVHVISGPLALAADCEIELILRMKASEVLRVSGMIAIAGDVPKPDDFARAYAVAMNSQSDRAGVTPLVLPGIDVTLDDRVTGLGLSANGGPGRQLHVTVPFVTVRSDALATLCTQSAALGCRIVGARVEVVDDRAQSAAMRAANPALAPVDISNLVLWLDGIAKFIDITKAHLPDLDSGRTLMMQRLSRHTIVLKKRLQELNDVAKKEAGISSRHPGGTAIDPASKC